MTGSGGRQIRGWPMKSPGAVGLGTTLGPVREMIHRCQWANIIETRHRSWKRGSGACHQARSGCERLMSEKTGWWPSHSVPLPPIRISLDPTLSSIQSVNGVPPPGIGRLASPRNAAHADKLT